MIIIAVGDAEEEEEEEEERKKERKRERERERERKKEVRDWHSIQYNAMQVYFNWMKDWMRDRRKCVFDWPAGQVAGWFLLLHCVRRFVIRHSLHPPAFSFSLVCLIRFSSLGHYSHRLCVNGQCASRRWTRSTCPTFVLNRLTIFQCQHLAIVQHGADEGRDGNATRQMGCARVEIHRVGKQLVG